jgi:hypothetical protein
VGVGSHRRQDRRRYLPDRRQDRRRYWLVIYGIVNCFLYAGLTPLWEGWDEPFHYGCVQEISRGGRLPALGRSVLSREIWDSLDDVPVADGVKKNIRKGIGFGGYFRLTGGERRELRRRLERLDPRTGSVASLSANYEAQQPPLAYLLLAPFDLVWRDLPLPARVFRLRLVCGFAAVLLTAWGMLRLAGLLEVKPVFADTALFVVFTSQMFYATTAHITNDWLAVPLFALVVAQGIAMYQTPRLGSALGLGALLGAALLTKAYFLPLVVLAAGIVVACARRKKLRRRDAALGGLLCLAMAAPWYVANLVRGNVSGMQETAAGAPAGELVRAALRLPWLKTLWSTAHSAMWTGNNSYVAFSGVTTTIMLALVAAGFLVYYANPERGGIAAWERIVLAAILLETLGLAYATVVFYWASHGAASTPSPWYWQALWPSAVVLLMLGYSRGGDRWRPAAMAMAGLWTYVLAATYVAKLVPYYAGLSDGRGRLTDIPQWYAGLLKGSAGALGTAALLPAGTVLALTGLAVAGAMGLCGWLCYRAATSEL